MEQQERAQTVGLRSLQAHRVLVLIVLQTLSFATDHPFVRGTDTDRQRPCNLPHSGVLMERAKDLAIADQHLAEHIEASITELAEQHAETVVSIEAQLEQVRLQIEKTLALLQDQILTLDDKINTLNSIPQNVTMQDLNVIPDRETAIKLVTEASKRNSRSYGVWLYSAGLLTLDEHSTPPVYPNPHKSVEASA